MKIKHLFMILLARLIKNDENYLKLMYYLKMHKRLRLKPYVGMRFTEKLQWLKLYGYKTVYTNYVDKAGVKELFKDIMIPSIGVYERFDDIDFDTLPNRFVIKCTHDSGGLVICKDKAKLNKDQAKRKIERCLNSNFFRITREYPYKDVPRKILVEEFIEDTTGEDLVDYKFFCFNGKAEFFKIDFERHINHKANYYDLKGNILPFGEDICPPDFNRSMTLPKNFDKMIDLANKLALKISSPFVRIDFYNVNGNIYLGEITFYPASGFGRFIPDEWDVKLGEMLQLPIDSKL